MKSKVNPYPNTASIAAIASFIWPNRNSSWHKPAGAAVVDMEGWAIWQAFPHVAMIRVISDDCQQDLPDISKAIAPNGNLKPITLTQAFLKQPAAAMKLIQGSLQGLHQLTQTAHQLNPHLTP